MEGRKYAAAGGDQAFLMVGRFFGKELWIIGWCTIFFSIVLYKWLGYCTLL